MKPQPNDDFEWVQADGGPALVCRALQPFADHLFTTRGWALGSRASASDEDWRPVGGSLGVDGIHLARARQVHGAAVVVRRAGSPAVDDRRLPEADIFVSDDPSMVLAIQTADCVPLLMADRVSGAVAAAHAGWRGLAAGVPRVAIEALAREFGCVPANLVAAVGPSISAERYEVGEDVRSRFTAAGFSDSQLARWFRAGARLDHWLFDGWRSALDQLESAGVAAENIHLSALCTATYPDLFCSYRRDGAGAGRMAAAIRKLNPKVKTQNEL